MRPAEARPATGRTLSLQRQADVLADAFRLLRDAERAGMPASRVAGARRRLQADPPPDESAVRALEASLRDFLGRRLRERVGEALGEVSGSGVEGRKAVKEY